MRGIVMAWVVVCALGAATPAAACINGVELEVDPRVELVASASATLDTNPAEAARRVLRAYPKLRGATLDGGLRSRAMRVMAVAIARLDGAFASGEWRAATPDERDAAYVWSMRVLRGLAMRQPTDPATLTDLGEALSRRAATRDEARKILELLAPRDLITTAHGWAALARARLAAGDTAGRAEAVARCAKMAKVIAICKVRDDVAG